MKRVICLYRVSTVGQVDHDDIPMQKLACREYAATHPDWEIVDEISEKGISGYKVSTNDRDAIVEIKKRAIMHKFDVLLVFMFDRIGRRDDETPFVVQWFVQQGMVFLEFRDGMNIQGIKIITERVVDVQGEDIRENSFYVLNIITDLMRQQIYVRGRSRVIAIKNGIQEDAALQCEMAGILGF